MSIVATAPSSIEVPLPTNVYAVAIQPDAMTNLPFWQKMSVFHLQDRVSKEIFGNYLVIITFAP
ncbi:MAG: hypothetical protein ACE3JU_15315 [Paenibacillus sp.]|uniref:hypothetical protein n=1 Tax=Paenibacillus sp. TaxID=58172 RepID=UPI003B829785